MDEINLIYSCIVRKDNKPIVRVTFEKNDQQGKKYAEGIVPDGKIERNEGFSEEEIGQLEIYLKDHALEIFNKAKEISTIMHWMK